LETGNVVIRRETGQRQRSGATFSDGGRGQKKYFIKPNAKDRPMQLAKQKKKELKAETGQNICESSQRKRTIGGEEQGQFNRWNRYAGKTVNGHSVFF